MGSAYRNERRGPTSVVAERRDHGVLGATLIDPPGVSVDRALRGGHNQTQGIDDAAVKGQLAAHYRQFDEQPPCKGEGDGVGSVADRNAARRDRAG